MGISITLNLNIIRLHCYTFWAEIKRSGSSAYTRSQEIRFREIEYQMWSEQRGRRLNEFRLSSNFAENLGNMTFYWETLTSKKYKIDSRMFGWESATNWTKTIIFCLFSYNWCLSLLHLWSTKVFFLSKFIKKDRTFGICCDILIFSIKLMKTKNICYTIKC